MCQVCSIEFQRYLVSYYVWKRSLTHHPGIVKGREPWNKNKKIQAHPNSLAILRKLAKGTTLPLLTVLIRKDCTGKKRRFIKIGERRWISYAVYIWLAKYGWIPHGHYIHHRDGNQLNDTFENFELVNSSAHSKIHAFDKYLARIRPDDQVTRGYVPESKALTTILRAFGVQA